MTGRLLDTCDALLLDLDGTVYRGGQAIPGVPAAIDAVRAEGVAVRFVTNNASRAPREVAEHLTAMGIDAEPDEISTSAQAGALVLAERLDPGREVLIVGSPALADEVRAVGLTPTDHAGPDTAAVVQGLAQDIAYPLLAEAAVALRAGALWVACNVDKTIPTERGLLPGNGALVAALRAATDLEPVVAGKPAAPLMEAAVKAAGAQSPLVVGDRLDTDIEGALAVGVPALFVMTGVDTPASLLAAEPHRRPTHIARNVAGVFRPAAELAVGPKDTWAVRDGRVSGDGDPLDLLRALCAAVWSGATRITAADDAADRALTALGITGREIG
ncbi:HAD-IIA family hydrolase [Actinokineospora sp. UTMC 2448]|uniref:HAD-IIA family hydrolase n=1 Tax=Actinokineospora sp. UTMC 2448 TaxID=2268449 RepID=UPI002164CA99|nr:HAD-IIA family hydrolase [Actinokineospora sp. UTMC 2448]UVS78325.1 putative hydrolase YutF [Actinokineospora sp. UTMC 2448]